MNWFEQLTGFREESYDATRAKLSIEQRQLRSAVNGKAYAIGEFEMASLQSLRERTNSAGGPIGNLKASVVRGDVREMHRAPQYAGALFQVASQFNALEMTGPSVTPEDGVARYEHDQVGAALSAVLGKPATELWQMRNGYAMCERAALDSIAEHLAGLGADEIDLLRGKLAVGIQWNVEVTDGADGTGPLVSQAFCSALPVAYSRVPKRHWQAFASLVLDAAYEATMLAAVLNAKRGASNIVLLTLVGGGAFGNDDAWILAAMRRAVKLVSAFDLDVRIVSYGAPSRGVLNFAAEFQ